MHKHVLRTIDGTLDHHTQIGDNDQALIDRTRGAFGFCVVAFNLDEKHAALAVIAIKVFSQIQREVSRLARLSRRHVFHLGVTLCQIVIVKAFVEIRLGKPAVGHGDQMLQLLRQQTANFITYAFDITRQHRKFFLTRQRQQRTLGSDT